VGVGDRGAENEGENMILRHLLLSLVGGTGVNWAADPGLRELFPELEDGAR